MLEAVVALMALGLIFGAGLAFASRVLAVKRDERIAAVEAVLPGANCGGCGLPGCGAFSEALVGGEVQPSSCPVADLQAKAMIADIMGMEVDLDAARQMAIVRCQGTHEAAKNRFEYRGIEDCDAAHRLGGGHKACQYGCLGFGNCVTVCPFDAIYMGDNGLPVVIEELCTACGNCVTACPRNIIELMEEELPVYVMCVSHDGPREARQACSKACIACGMCVRKCPQKAITMVDSLVEIDYEKCDGCGICIQVCPTGALVGPAASGEEEVAS